MYTDAHIDTLARFLDVDTIAYVKCKNTEDIHFDSLKLMEEELMNLKTYQAKNKVTVLVSRFLQKR